MSAQIIKTGNFLIYELKYILVSSEAPDYSKDQYESLYEKVLSLKVYDSNKLHRFGFDIFFNFSSYLDGIKDKLVIRFFDWDFSTIHSKSYWPSIKLDYYFINSKFSIFIKRYEKIIHLLNQRFKILSVFERDDAGSLEIDSDVTHTIEILSNNGPYDFKYFSNDPNLIVIEKVLEEIISEKISISNENFIEVYPFNPTSGIKPWKWDGKPWII